MIDCIFKHKKQIITNLMFSSVPMVIGCIIYLLSDEDIILFKHFSCLSEKIKLPENTNISISPFIRNYLCDMCWAFSLECALFLFFEKSKKHLIISAIISSFVSIIIELFQKLSFLSGTFDPIDIILETVAVIAASFILNNIWEDKT